MEQNVRGKDPTFIFLNGHGSSVSIHGHNNEPLVELNVNHHILENKIVHALACDAGKELGRECKAKAFIGYSGRFWLCMDRFSISQPKKDKLAAPIMESALEAPKQLLKGKTPKEAFEKSQEYYNSWIEEFTHSESKYTTEELQTILPILYINRSFQVLIEN